MLRRPPKIDAFRLSNGQADRRERGLAERSRKGKKGGRARERVYSLPSEIASSGQYGAILHSSGEIVHIAFPPGESFKIMIAADLLVVGKCRRVWRSERT